MVNLRHSKTAVQTVLSPHPVRRNFSEGERVHRSLGEDGSLDIVTAKCEPGLADAKPELRYQFERMAYFALDLDSKPDKLVFNRTLTLRDTRAKEVKKVG